MTDEEFDLTEKEWRKRLTQEEYHILREKGTEPAFTGEYVDNKDNGNYLCAACGQRLFDSDKKYDSGSGWPSFTKPCEEKSVSCKEDYSHGMHRVEVLCARCHSHLGHVFDDGPKETGKRYCINSAALKFQSKDDSNH